MKDAFPFAFDFTPMTEAFKDNGFEKFFPAPAFDMSMFKDAHEKNMAALTEANKVAMAGYSAILKRQQELFEGAMADAKTRMSDMQAKPVTTESAMENFETMKAAFEQGIEDLKGVIDMASDASKEAFEILKTRGEEVMAEMKAVTEKTVN